MESRQSAGGSPPDQHSAGVAAVDVDPVGSVSPGRAEAVPVWVLGRSVTLSFLALVLMMAVVTALALRQFHSLAAAADAVEQTHEVIRSLDRVLLLMTHAESGQRGYLLTNEDVYLEPYERAVLLLDQEARHLHELVRNDPEQVRRLGDLTALVVHKQEVMAENLAAHRRGEPGFSRAGREVMDRIRDLLAQAEVAERRHLVERSDRVSGLEGTVRWVLSLGGAFCVVAAASLVGLNIRARHSMLRSRAAQNVLRDVLESMSDAFFHIDRGWRFTYLNGRAEAYFGRTDGSLRGVQIWDSLPAARDSLLHERFQASMAERQVVEFEAQSVLFPDRYLSLRVFPTSSGLAVFFRDITEQRKLQEQLLHAAKMESIGRLAGGVAHDFNNLLTVIFGYLELAEVTLGPGHPSLAHMSGARDAAERGAAVTRQLLAFARRQVIVPRVVNVNQLVDNLEGMLRRLMTENIQVTTFCGANLGSVEVDPDQFEQVVINLAVNARDAMPDGGKLTIETSNVSFDEQYAASHPEVTPGEYVLIAVSDTGVGMDDEVRAHAFQPFYSTKDRGKGGGLGLAACYGFVKQSHGHMWVHSEKGRGTTFKIYLPRVNKSAERRPHNGPVEYGRGTETVLLVEDEPMVRRLALNALEGSGRRVIEAGTAEDALEKAEAYDGIIDILVTDVVLPGMNGRQLSQRITAARPGVRVLFTSGYADNMIVHHGVLDPAVEFLQKPYTPTTLLRKVAEVMGVEAEVT